MKAVKRQVPDCATNLRAGKFVFKKCREKGRLEEFLMVLEKPDYIDSKPFVCNELRKTYFDNVFVKYRCNGLITRFIYSLASGKLHDHVAHYTEYCSISTMYRVDHLVIPSHFDTNLERVCAAGIHYFLTPQEAISYVL